MVTHGYQIHALFLTSGEKDSPSVSGTEIAVELTFEGFWELMFIDNCEIIPKVGKKSGEQGAVRFWNRVFDPVDHKCLEFIIDGKPLSSDGESQGKGKTVLASAGGEQNGIMLANHRVGVYGFSGMFDKTHDPGGDIPLQERSIG
jgi:hypothetical protein